MTQEHPRSVDELSWELGRVLEKIYAQTPNMEFDEILRSYDDVESAFLPKVAGNESLIKEAKRRIAELKLFSAIEKHCPFELCQALFNDLSHHLGFTNLEKKANVYIIYSRYCLEMGHYYDGRSILEQLKIELEEKLGSNVPIYEHLLKIVSSLLNQFPI